MKKRACTVLNGEEAVALLAAFGGWATLVASQTSSCRELSQTSVSVGRSVAVLLVLQKGTAKRIHDQATTVSNAAGLKILPHTALHQ